ncbi:steroid alpha reductase family protein [Aureobasidium sp. EXF-10727]|nr:steroid alpha reductase family protein [Aureobasidium sp. EXF-10727]KAI4726161.1 steroid alpha reductase family protein [Aureobasidium sp. EXF-10728]
MSAITVVSRSRAVPGLPYELRSVPKTSAELYDQVASATGLSIHRLRISTMRDGTGVVSPQPIGVELSGAKELFVKDLGPQVSWREVYIIEYIGALVAHPLIYSLRLSSPSSVQTLLLVLVTVHFIKRELETIFVHRFSNATMPLRNIFKNSFHYWILSGVMLAWAFYKPETPTDAQLRTSDYLGSLIFLFGELANLYIHLILRNLRPKGTVKRQIPQGLGFNWVTCPNYMYETVAWTGILIISRSWTVLVFILVAVAQMWAWAWKKEMRYRREFPDSYLHKRFVVLPGIC